MARLGEVEARLEREIQSEAPFITEACRHLMHAGGKRFRPLLVLLAAETADADAEGVLTAACVVELTHLASLYHDDVMDEAALRRGCGLGERPVGQPRRDPGRGLALLEVLGADRRARSGRGADPGRDVHPARGGADPRDPAAAGGPGPAGALPAGGRRQDRLADRHLGALRRDVRRRRPQGRSPRSRSTASGSASPSSSPTTSSTWAATRRSPGRRPAPTCARVCRRCRSCWRCAPTDPADARLRRAARRAAGGRRAARRGARPAALARRDAAGPQLRAGAGRRRPRSGSPCCRRARPRTRSSRSPS